MNGPPPEPNRPTDPIGAVVEAYFTFLLRLYSWLLTPFMRFHRLARRDPFSPLVSAISGASTCLLINGVMFWRTGDVADLSWWILAATLAVITAAGCALIAWAGDTPAGWRRAEVVGMATAILATFTIGELLHLQWQHPEYWLVASMTFPLGYVFGARHALSVITFAYRRLRH